MTLFDDVAETLDGAGIPFALIGAGALAVYGVVRSTFDHDLLTTSPKTLNTAFWDTLRAAVVVEVHRGDEHDPLLGVVRLTAPGERDVDLIVGRTGWLDDVLVRRVAVPLIGRDVPTVTVADLMLLKLYAGGTQDMWDIEQLLAVEPDVTVREDVESRLSHLPPYAGALWQRLTSAG